MLAFALLGACADPSMQLPELPEHDIDAELYRALQTLHDAALQEPKSGERRGQLTS